MQIKLAKVPPTKLIDNQIKVFTSTQLIIDPKLSLLLSFSIIYPPSMWDLHPNAPGSDACRGSNRLVPEQ